MESEYVIQARTFRVGDRWSKTYLCTDQGEDPPSFSTPTLLIQIRNRDGDLIASSGPAGDAEGVIHIDLTGSNLGAETPVIMWATDGDTNEVDFGDIFYCEGSVETTEGVPVTIVPGHRLYIIDQIAKES